MIAVSAGQQVRTQRQSTILGTTGLAFAYKNPANRKTLSDFARRGCLMGEMNEKSDVQLLRDYAEGGHEAAFRELVERYAGLVYAGALRQVTSPDLARDIAQSVFTDLARKARLLVDQTAGDRPLAGWLHRSTRYAALNHGRDTRRRIANERQAMEQLIINSATAPVWENIRPLLDEALDSLDEDDREALLLRYFKNQDFHAVGLALGVSDDTAQKRVSRAVERLRDYFSRRNVTIGAGTLTALLAANAVQAVPAGLAAAFAATALAGTGAYVTAVAATKTAALATLPKVLAAGALAIALGTAIYQTHQNGILRQQVLAAQQDQAPLTLQIQQLQQERDDALSRLAQHPAADPADTSASNLELLRLRGEVTVLRRQLAETPSAGVTEAVPVVIPAVGIVRPVPASMDGSATTSQIINLTNAPVSQVLELYGKIFATELVVAGNVTDRHPITFRSDRKEARAELHHQLNQALLDQAGIVMTGLGDGRTSVTYNDGLDPRPESPSQSTADAVSPAGTLILTARDVNPKSVRLATSSNLVFEFAHKSSDEIGAIIKAHPQIVIRRNGETVIQARSYTYLSEKVNGQMSPVGLVLIIHDYGQAKLAEQALRGN